MGIIFNRSSQDDGCSGHHYGERKLKSVGTHPGTPHNPKACLEITSVRECQHDNCCKTREVTGYAVTSFDTQDELREALKDKIDELKADKSDN